MAGTVHFSSASSAWYTPAHVLQRVIAVLGAIDLDPAAECHANPTVPASRHYTSEDDGLTLPWRGRVYLNPPYGRQIGHWVAKLCASYEAGDVTAAIALLPARTDTAWFQRLRDYPACFVHGRLKFSGFTYGAPFPSAIVYLGQDVERFILCFADLGDIRSAVLAA